MSTSFFTHCEHHTDEFARNFSKGKSFNFSEWNPEETYRNDAFVQDFVTYNGMVWACMKTSTNEPPSISGDSWIAVLTANGITRSFWDQFEVTDGETV